MQTFGFLERSSFSNQPVEKWHHARVTPEYETFGMPLDAYYGLEASGFHGFYYTVGRTGTNPETWSRFFDSLMVEGIDC